MDYNQLTRLCEENEVHLDNPSRIKRTPPFYYDSLRPAFGYYFNTFNTFNASYDEYAEGLHGKNIDFLQHRLLDEDNTILTMVTFERFFELYLKNLLRKTNINLVYKSKKRGLSLNDIIQQIEANTFAPFVSNGMPYTLPFRETISRFYGLIDLSKNGNTSATVNTFSQILKTYPFFDSADYKASLELLNWYRDRILHNGNKLPNLWLLDYLITQHVIPMVRDIVQIDAGELGQSLFYFKTPTGIDVVEKLSQVKFKFDDLKDGTKIKQTFINLLHIGHLKELGRASLNMSIYERTNQVARYEYNYHDPHGRGKRFATVENAHPDFKDVKYCPCCGIESLAHYRVTIQDVPSNNPLDIDWVKCYTCDYHIRYNVEEPYLFGLNSTNLFS